MDTLHLQRLYSFILHHYSNISDNCCFFLLIPAFLFSPFFLICLIALFSWTQNYGNGFEITNSLLELLKGFRNHEFFAQNYQKGFKITNSLLEITKRVSKSRILCSKLLKGFRNHEFFARNY